MNLGQTQWWEDLMHGIYGPRKGGARIIIDAEDAATGVGKTGLAVSLAMLLSRVFGYELQKEDMTLSGDEYLQRWREHPDKEQPSVVILDELSGAGAGDARRSMSNQNVNLGRSWQLMRKKRVVTITTLPHWSDADKKMRGSRTSGCGVGRSPSATSCPTVWARPSTLARSTPTATTTSTGFAFPNLDAEGEQLYRYLSSLKDDLLESEYFDADELAEGGEAEKLEPDEARREQKIKDAQRMRDRGLSTTQIADYIDMSQSWVSQYTESPERAEAAD